MGLTIGYIGNTPVYDNRMRGLPARPVGVTDVTQPGGPHHYERQEPSGEDRFQRKLKSLKLADAEPCELLVPHQGEHSRRMSWLLMDGVKTEAELIAFNLRGNGIYLETNDSYLIRQWGGLRVFDPKELRIHHCHARGCKAPVPPKLFMCGHHWGMVPKMLQAAIWRHYQEGQELGNAVPTRQYMAYTDQAIRAVADLEAARKEEDRQRQAEIEERRRLHDLKVNGATRRMFGA